MKDLLLIKHDSFFDPFSLIMFSVFMSAHFAVKRRAIIFDKEQLKMYNL
jgi:hypothetical protein